MKITLIIIS